METVILCAGQINFTHLPVSTNTTNSMIPINGKPVISWILNDLLDKNIDKVTIVARAEDEHLKQFICRSYSSKIDLNLVQLENSASILDSLFHGLETVQGKKVAVVLGDTLIKDPFHFEEDLVYVHEVKESNRWCLARIGKEQLVLGYFDKVKDVKERPYQALCGYYHFTDSVLLKALLKQVMADGKSQLSDLLEMYQNYRPIKAKQAKQWFDFGNIDKLIESKQQLLQSRYFNALSIDPVLNTITKVSVFDEKLQNELNWYESLPPKLAVLAPRIISKERVNGQLHLVQEYYGYPTLAELFIYSSLDEEAWQGIIKKLLEIHGEFRKFPFDLTEDNAKAIYIDKTINRLSQLWNEDESWEQLFSFEALHFNQQPLKGFPQLKEHIINFAEKIVQNAKGAIIHGDFCFSNILYDFNNQIARLIDPRGSFGSKGIYGDPRYDLAKLRHSLAGLYDYIVSDLFKVELKGNYINYQIFAPEEKQQIAEMLDSAIVEAGYDLREIQFIEGLLFLSMLPLHKDKPQRQQLMFVRGIQLMNQLFA